MGRKSKIQLTEELEKEIINFYLAPHTGKETTQKFNISQTKLSYLLKAENIPQHNKELVQKLSRAKAKQTCLVRYGTEYPGGLPEFVEKAQATNIEKYGVRVPAQNDEILAKIQSSCLSHFGTKTPAETEEVKEKIRRTNQERFGVDWVQQCPEVIQKSKNTLLEHFGVDRPLKAPKIQKKTRQTCEEKYGVSYVLQADCVKNKIKQTNLKRFGAEYPIQNSEVLKKQQETNYAKYNSLSILTSDYLKQFLIDKFGVESYTQTKEFLAIQRETKKINCSFKTSKSEEILYISLLKTYGVDNVLRQYVCEKYPFCCDFYIPAENLFIELNLSWTHGKHPFDENSPDDKALLEKWEEKAKTSKYYQNAIETWTVRDVKKLKTAKENNLNYRTIYIDEWNQLKKELQSDVQFS